MKDFKAFILRGNVVDLAIGVVIGAAFKGIIDGAVDLVTNIAAIPGKTGFGNLQFTIGGGVFRYGTLIQAIVNFVIVAIVLFFFVVRPVNRLMNRRRTEPEVDSLTRECPECLSSIPKAAKRCAFCTAEVGVEAA